jgi:hypothetical protein
MDIRSSKPIIEEIIIPPDVLELIVKHGNLKSTTERNQLIYIRRYAGCACNMCGAIPTKKVIYSPMEGVKLGEPYCDSCFKVQGL